MNATTNTVNPFDFSNLSDLPADLQAKLATETTNNAAVYAEVIRKGAEAGFAELEINQIIAAAIRMGIEVPTQQTVRGYLNKAVELKLVSKPSRQTYGVGTVAVSAPVAAEEAAVEVAPKGKAKAEAVVSGDDSFASDPLAGLGI